MWGASSQARLFHTLLHTAPALAPFLNNSDHSLGVGHLAQKWASHIYSFQGNEVSMDHMDITCVTLAGVQRVFGECGVLGVGF